VWVFAIPQTNYKKDMRIHPTQKPSGLYKRIIETAIHAGDSVLDPFAGSGTTGHAALQTATHCRLIEMNPEYVEKIFTRLRPIWEAETKKEGVDDKS
jgi:site-specific DNA-methyltransferase (adenine-specific)